MATKSTTVSPDETRSITNWQAFNDAKLIPVSIQCDGYQPMWPTNLGCHTRLPLKAEVMVNHIPEHGGAFRMVLESDATKWPGWEELAKLGVECSDCRCEVCDAQVPMRAPALLKHMKVHPSKHRRNQQGGQFNFSLTFDKSIFDDQVGDE